MDVKLLKSGYAVRVYNLRDLKYDQLGFLSSFYYQDVKYKHFEEGDRFGSFKDTIFEEHEFKSGFYNIDLYNEYMLDSSKYSYLDLREEGRFKSFLEPQEGDFLRVVKLSLDPPYTKFLKKTVYETRVQDPLQVYTDYHSNSPIESLFTTIYEAVNPRDPGVYATSFFNNYLFYLQSIQDENESAYFAKFLAGTALRIQSIENEIIPILVNSENECENTEEFDLAIQKIRESWLSPNILSSVNINSLIAFYKQIGQLKRAVFRNQLKLKTTLCEDRLFWLFHLLPAEVLKNFTYSTKFRILKDVFKNEEIYGEKLLIYNTPPNETLHETMRDYTTPDPTLEEIHQRLVSKMFFTFRDTEADDILDYLLIKEDGLISNFEKFYHSLNDADLEDFTFVSWFVDQKTKRAAFCQGVYQLWKTSKYNPYYLASETSLNGINVNSYWINNEKGFHELQSQPPIIIFSKDYEYDTSPYTSHSRKKIRFPANKELENSLYINIYKYIGQNKQPNRRATYYVEEGESFPFGKYHLFHPIVLIGYSPNSKLVFPVDAPHIPAFLFYHAQEFDRLKDHNASLNLALEIGIEAALFFVGGSFAMLKHFRHLKYVTNWWRVDQLAASEVVMFWKAYGKTGQAISVYAANVSSFLQYHAAISNNSETQELYRNLSIFFILLSFTSSLVPDNISGVKRLNLGEEQLSEVTTDIVTHMDINLNHTIPESVEQLVRNVNSEIEFASDSFSYYLGGLTSELSEVNFIRNKFDSVLSPTSQNKFKTDFYEFQVSNDIPFWNRMNQNGANIVDEWRYMVSLEIGSQMRSNLDVLDDIKLLRNADIKNSQGISILDEVVFSVSQFADSNSISFLRILTERTSSFNDSIIDLISTIDSIKVVLRTDYNLYNKLVELVENLKYTNINQFDDFITSAYENLLLNIDSSNASFITELDHALDQLKLNREVKLSYSPTSYINSEGIEIPCNPPPLELDVISQFDEVLEGSDEIITKSAVFETKRIEVGIGMDGTNAFKSHIKEIGNKFSKESKFPAAYRDQFDELHGVIDITDGNLLTFDEDDLLYIIIQQVENANAQQSVPDFIVGLNRLNSLIVKKKGVEFTTFTSDMW